MVSMPITLGEILPEIPLEPQLGILLGTLLELQPEIQLETPQGPLPRDFQLGTQPGILPTTINPVEDLSSGQEAGPDLQLPPRLHPQ